MSRLWTLQEASLARTIWIDFKDQPVELDVLMAYMAQLGHADLAFLPFNFDILKQFYSLRLDSPDNISNEESSSNPVAMSLFMLDMALQHRATTVAANEPLCIGNLLDLPAEEILKVPATSTARMGRVWELIATKYGGIPQHIIAFELPRLTERGKRWAPRSLLVMKDGNFESPGSKAFRWMDSGLGIPVADGLLVKFPGFRLHLLRQPEDEMIRNPWKTSSESSETRLLFASDVDGRRYELNSPVDIFANADESEAEGLARNPSLHDLVRSRSCAILLLEKPTAEMNCNGLLVQIVKNTNEVLYVEYKYHILVSNLRPAQNLVFGTAERLARSLRQEPVVANVARLMPESESDKESDEYKSAVDMLKLRIQAVTAKALLNNTKFGSAWKSVFGDDAAEDLLWKVVAHWLYNDFILTKLPEDQMWCVD